MSDSNLTIYKAVYSGVPVYELMCRGIAVMRRKQDSYLNATQILKVAGIEKGKRTKILEREVLPGDHEKVQGGYGKYQGTCDSYDERDYEHGHGTGQFLDQPPEGPPLEGAEKYRTILMSIFLNDEQDQIPGMLTDPESPPDLDINLVIDDQGHTAIHWAAALARIPVLDLLIQKQADIRRVNYNGESALIRAVLVTNNFDKQSFPHVLSLLHSAIPLVDRKNRTVLHHIAVTAGIRGRETSSRYYMECLFEWIARHGGDFASIVDIQDKTGDTALTIAARVGDRYLTKILLDVGANREIENKVGLKAEDFGIDDSLPGSSGPPPPVRPVPVMSKEAIMSETPAKRGKDLMNVVQRMVDELDLEFSHEIMARQGQLQDTQALLRHSTSELSNTRRTIKQCRAQALQLTEAQQKIKNLEQSLEEESQKTRGQKGYSSTLRQKETVNEDIDRLFCTPVRPSPQANADESSGSTEKERELNAQEEVLMLKARILAYEQNEKELAQELAVVKDQSLDRELQCRKVISICCNIPLEKVDEMLVPLTLAVESDGASLDLSRVAGFMSKVKKQDAIASTAL
ncbi:transcriptional regulator swi6 [Mortierella sp. AD094]|nr:transcriptional regulator swi6 [Mortierella sp. AD094]